MIRRWIALDRCVACGAGLDGNNRTLEVADPFGVTLERFKVVRCGRCGTWLLNPRPAPEEMSRFYQADFLYAPPGSGASLITRLAARVQSLNLASEVNWVCRELPPGGSYLDFSAGNGQILAAVAQRRPDARLSATEYSETFRRRIEDRLPGLTVPAGLDGLPADARFDVISAFGVLEHAENPLELLRVFRSRLTPEGTILVSIPNPLSVQSRIFGRRWYNWVAPRHFQLIPRATFLKFVRGANLHVAGEHHFFLRTASSTLALSMCPGLDPLLRPTNAKVLAYGILFAALLPIEWGFAQLKASGFMGFRLKP